MLSASAAPRWKRQMSTLPRELVSVAAPFASSAANALRRRNDGASPIVTNAIAPDFMNTLRFIRRSPSLEFGRAQRQTNDLLQPAELIPFRRQRVFAFHEHFARVVRD